MKMFGRDPDPLERLREAQEAAQEAHTAFEDARNARAAREEKMKRLRDEVAEAEAEAERTALLPGGGSATATATRQVEAVEAEIQELRGKEAQAREAWGEAKARAQEVARKLAPEMAEAVREAKGRKVEALAEVGRALLDLAGAAEAAEQEGQDARRKLQEVLHQAKPSSLQTRELDAYTREPGRDAGPEAELGHVVMSVLLWWTRLANGREDVSEVLKEAGIRPRDGSVLFGPGSSGAPPISRQTAYDLHQSHLQL